MIIMIMTVREKQEFYWYFFKFKKVIQLNCNFKKWNH